ncbi:MAG TPA: Crp/Fnr family transcriptional regulator [Solirubrobacteraceae bacterium]|nr:Crp/Fnr family transcriptional regulator [Solirubrobacteraceae bacterium]
MTDQWEVGRVQLLEADSELAACVAAEELEHARRTSIAEVVTLRRGMHDPSNLGPPHLLGLLVVDGLMVSILEVAQRRCHELIGPGTLLRPWDQCGDTPLTPCAVRWKVLEPMTIARLDERVMRICARWPAMLGELTRRAILRSHDLALMMAIHSLQHVEIRLLVLLWHLADRFGKVTPEGTAIPLKLTHADLAGLIGAQRPSTSAKLSKLCDEGRLSRRPDRTWLLHGHPPDELQDIRTRARGFGSGAPPPQPRAQRTKRARPVSLPA